MKKRVIAGLLATVMVLGMAGCGNTTSKEGSGPVENNATEEVSSTADTATTVIEEPKEPVTIVYYYMNNVGEQQYTNQVEEKLNEILKGLEGYEHISMDLVPCGTDYAQAFTLAQASGTQIDLVSTYGLDFSTLVSNGDFMPLEDLLASHPDVVSEVPEWLVETGNVHGTLYQIPTYQQAANVHFLCIPKVYLDMTGKTKEDVREILWNGTQKDLLDFYEELCLASRKGTGKDTKYIYDEFQYSQYECAETIGGLTGLYFVEEDSSIVYDYLSDGYKEKLERFAQWFVDGLIHPDIATLKSSEYDGKNFMNDVSFVFQNSNGAYTEEMREERLSASAGTEVVCITKTDHYFIPSKYEAGGNAIYADCKHPEEAMMIIELLMTDKGEEFYNTLVWGLEGTHYEWVEEGKRIKTLEYDGSQGGTTSTYHAFKWNVGNTFNCWLNQAVQDGINEYIENEVHNGETTTTSAVMGITWDLSSVADQVAQVKAVMKEYDWKSIIICGKDWEARYNEMVQKLNAAGIQDIIACAEKQYADFMAK